MSKDKSNPFITKKAIEKQKRIAKEAFLSAKDPSRLEPTKVNNFHSIDRRDKISQISYSDLIKMDPKNEPIVANSLNIYPKNINNKKMGEAKRTVNGKDGAKLVHKPQKDEARNIIPLDDDVPQPSRKQKKQK